MPVQKASNAVHQHSHQLANKAYMLKREDLKIKNMSSSAKGTVENPDKNVKAKSGLTASFKMLLRAI